MTAGIGARAAIWMTIVVLIAGPLPLFIAPSQGAGGDEWGYHTSFQIASVISDLARSHPDRATATTAQELFGLHPLEGGRTIPILFIGDPSEGGRPNVMLIGAHHGNEPDSAEAVLGFAYYLLEEDYDINSELMDSVNVIVLPVVNPYGLDNGIRTDEDGQDINRDYPFAPSGPSSDSDGIPLTTQGARVVHELAKKYPIEIALSFHTGSWGIFTPWGAQGMGNITPDHRSFMALGKALSKASAQSMTYGPANDFSGISYLTGAYDDHLYGSSVVPELVYSQGMVLPWSTASLTVELRTGTGKDPEGLGSPSEMDNVKPSARAIPTAIRICLAACMLASQDVRSSSAGSMVEFKVIGAGSADDLVMSEVLDDGKTIGIQPTVEADPLYPIITLSASPGNDATSVYLSGSIHKEWMDPVHDASPKLSPRSLLSISSMRDVWDIVPIGSMNAPQPLHLVPAFMEPSAGSAFNVTVNIATSDRIMDLTLMLSSDGAQEKHLFRGEELIWGDNDLTVKAPVMEGYAVLTATLRTGSGTFEDSMPILVRPDLVWTAKMTGSELEMTMDLEGTPEIKPILMMLRPTGLGSKAPQLLRSEFIGPGENIIALNISDLSGAYSVSAWIPPMDRGREEIFDIPPTFTVSRVPIRLVEGHLLIGPVTAYLGSTSLERTGAFGTNSIRAILSSNGRTETFELDHLPLGSMTDSDRGMAYDQAVWAGSDPADLNGAFFLEVEHPDHGHYSLECYLENDAGMTPAPRDGHATNRTMYGSFSIEDGKHDFPYLLVLIFVAFIVVMLVVSYLRFPAKMESIARKEMGQRRNGR